MFRNLLVATAGFFLLQAPVSAFSDGLLTRCYIGADLGGSSCTNIVLRGSLLHIAKFKTWLNEIATVPYGRQTLQDILTSGHQLVLEHSDHARISAGRTMAAMTQDLTNGIGADVKILFDGSVTEQGSHLVYNSARELIDYTAVENLYHELSHARHKMKGTWRYFDSEGQAIEDENAFRESMARQKGVPVRQRYWKTGVPIENVVDIRSLPRKYYPIRSNPPNHAKSL